MVLDVLHAEHAGGGPGFVLVRIHGRARAERPCRLAPPALLVAEDGELVRLPPVAGTAPLAAGPDAPAFALDVPVPLHLAHGDGGWWLEPPVAAPPAADPTARDEQLAGLRARLAALAEEVAALRARVDEAAAAPAPTPVPRPILGRLSAALPAVLVTVGALAIGDAAATYFWQEPLSAIYAARQQSALRGDLADLDRTLARAPLAAHLPPRPEQRMRALARALEDRVDAGRPLGKLTIPRIGANFVVVQGTGSGSLRRGPGHYSSTALPGERGTVGIAGHRTTYGAPFRHLDELRRGDPIDLRMPYGVFRYRVEGTRIVRPQDVSVLDTAGHDRLALTACHPLYSAARRIVVMARLERATPSGAAASTPASAPPAGGDGAVRTPAA